MEAIVPLITLIALEVILGIDNIIFISILADKLPENQRNKLRVYGIGLAMIIRLNIVRIYYLDSKIRYNLVYRFGY
jgi:predicted tellurium resistance membrane protein TerC